MLLECVDHSVAQKSAPAGLIRALKKAKTLKITSYIFWEFVVGT